MRDILFRGKRTDNGEWVYGSLWLDDAEIKNCETASISWWSDDKTVWNREEVEIASIGQYTGLTDKNGKKIFEGDVVKDNSFNYRLLCDNRNKCRTGVAVIKYGLHEVPSEDPFCWGDAFGFYFEGETLYPTPAQYHPYNEYSKSTFEVIGNIHDNPELLQRRNEK